MQLKEIIKNAGLMLGKSDVVNYVDGSYDVGSDTYDTVNLMVNLSNLVINELACTYLPLVAEEEISFSYGKAFYKNFNKKAVKIIGVYTITGQVLDFIDKTEYVFVPTKSNVIENLVVEYQYSPTNYALEDEIGYTEKDISSRVIAYGVASEVCIIEGEFEQAVMHHKRYVDEIALLTMPKNAMIKQRSWK